MGGERRDIRERTGVQGEEQREEIKNQAIAGEQVDGRLHLQAENNLQVAVT